ncbi:CCR4-NOT transcription complex subunit 1-like [Limulus polyphemus]|uniref:CCR4-NOT transcription complex subunit 1-like n=1 Tax=Limulus polyphemus TaxID=6850 RepID=A0ABM1SDM9_LIMPO|nr:CCR4-NOT transcription complex subunit 1-like [Limulus polyphemus]
MNLDSLSFALSQISYSVTNLTKKNFKSGVQEISRLVAQHGLEAERHLLRCLFSHIDFSGDGKSSGKDFHQIQYLTQECASLISKPSFVSNLCSAIDKPLHHQKSLRSSSQLLSNLSKVLKLTRVQEVAFGLALLHSSNSDLCNHATQFLKQKVPELLRSYTDSDSTADQEGSLQDSAPEFLHLLLIYILHSPKDQVGLTTEQKESFLQSLRRDFPQPRVPVILAPLLYPQKQEILMEKAVSETSAMAKQVDDSVADLVREMGYCFTASVEDCKTNLLHLCQNQIMPSVVARILSVMARTHTGLGDSISLQSLGSGGSMWNDSKDKNDGNHFTTWSVDVFVQALHELVPSLNWKEVVQELDHPGFLLKDRQGLKLLWHSLIRGLNREVFPSEYIYRHWRNSEGQLSLFQQILKNSDLLCLLDYNCHTVVTDILKAPPEDDNRDISNWKSLDLIETLLHLSDVSQCGPVQELFKFPVQHCPDILVLGLLQISGSLNLLRQELLSNLIPVFLGNHSNSAIVLHYAWHAQVHAVKVRPIIMHAMAEWYLRGDCDQARLSRILDVAQDLKALSVLLNGNPFSFVIDLACLASRREYLKLDKWLSDKIQEHGFGSSFLLGLNTSTVMSSAISSASIKTGFAAPTVDRLRQGDMSAMFPEMSQQVSKEVEDEANGYFQRIYNHPPHPTLSIDEVLEMLKKFQESPNKREREVFSCMLRNLFEEYRFFPQYPDKELLITAQLFGGIIEQGLVTFMSLGLALRYVLDALRKPHGSKMYFFGITALDRFKTRLKEYPQYCQHLSSIAHFPDFPSHLIEYIEYGARTQEPPNHPQGLSLPQSMVGMSSGFGPIVSATARTVTTTTATVITTATTTKPSTIGSGKPSIANATNIDTLLVATEKDEKMVIPPESVQDKVGFIINNLSQINLAQKTEEFKELVKEDYWPWASQYLVMKRASIEHNFHTLYSNFLDTLRQVDLSKLVVRETFRNIKVLLRSDKGIANFSDRSLLKNLGHWLGMLTLAKNKPIMQIDIDIKSLLIEAYHKGQQELLYVVPFVAKVLESCGKSRVFKPPNPWTMGIMSVLAELHQEPELKLTLKFEIEVLCKNLNLDINDLKKEKISNVFKDHHRLARIEPQLSPLPKRKEQMLNISIPQPKIQSSSLVPASTAAPPKMVQEEVSAGVQAGVVTVRGSTTPTGGSSATPMASGFPQPQFAYLDINVLSITGLSQHIQINNQLPLLQSHPHLKQVVKSAIEHAVQEWLGPVGERSIRIAIGTCEQIVKKDFALDPEEARMRTAAHHMVRSLTAGMVMITCREPLNMSITTNLKASFLSALRGATQQQKELVEQAATVVAQENIELACCFIQKTAVEKAVLEIDKKLASEYDRRKHARAEERRYCDPVVLTYQAERMPEQIRLKVGGVTLPQMAVYEEFARNIPGFLPSHERDSVSNYISKPLQVSQSFSTDDITQIYDKVIAELDRYIQSLMAIPASPQAAALHSLREGVFLVRTSREIVTALTLVQKTVESLLEGMTQHSPDPEVAIRYRDGHLLVLKALADPRAFGTQWTVKHVTRALIECRDDYRYNLEGVDCLIRSHLVNMPSYDLHLTQLMEGGLNYLAVAFAMQLVKLYIVDKRHDGFFSEGDLYHTVEILARIATHSRQPPEGLSQLIDMVQCASQESGFLDRAPGGPMSMMHSGISQAREYDDPPGLHEKTEYLLREWVNMYHNASAGRDSTKAFTMFVHQMNVQGILKTDDLITRFFRLSTEMCTELCYRAFSDQSNPSPSLVRAKCFHTLDAYVRLITLLVKHSGDANNSLTKINLLHKVLGIVAGVLLRDHDFRSTEFQQLPYHRIFIMLFLELSAPEQVLESISVQVLNAFCNTLHILQPSKAPGFAYAWLELVSHRVFLGKMLVLTPQQRAWGMYAQLLIDMFKFLAPFLRNVELPKQIQLLYKGTLRVLLVLLHDFPEFLCDYHYGFCDVIPPNCIQMRNLILSAFPRHMRLPDPFTPNLKVDLLPEITQAPRVLTNFASMIQPANFKKDLDSYINSRSPVTFLSELRSNLQVSNEPGMRYNIPLINALVLYVGTQAISHIQTKGQAPSMGTITHSSHMDIFQNLAVDLDTEGRYLFLNAITNQLRYPNSHTHYFSCTLLYLFAEANTEAIQEQITRVLLERLIVNRPHPWGLLVTFIELIKNPTFKFWNHEFVRCAPEIEKLFDSVARSCMPQKPSSDTAST